MSEYTKREDFDTAEQLLDALSPTAKNDRWLPEPSDWCFRGHDHADDALVPTSFRSGSWDAFEWHPGMHDERSREMLALKEFQRAADHAGLEIPGDAPSLRKQGYELAYTFGGSHPDEDWPYNEVLGVMALARHYGVPARLLDWTWKPHVAAYFACIGLARERVQTLSPARYQPDGRFAVWAFNTKFFDWLMTAAFEGTTAIADWVSRRKRFALVTAPYASNPNLAAQAGVFTLDRHPRPDTGFDAQIGPIALELLANSEVRRVQGPYVLSPTRADPRVPAFHQFTVPQPQSVRLLRLLAYRGVTAATVFPGPDGVVQAMKDRRIWERDGVFGAPPLR